MCMCVHVYVGSDAVLNWIGVEDLREKVTFAYFHPWRGKVRECAVGPVETVS